MDESAARVHAAAPNRELDLTQAICDQQPSRRHDMDMQAAGETMQHAGNIDLARSRSMFREPAVYPAPNRFSETLSGDTNAEKQQEFPFSRSQAG